MALKLTPDEMHRMTLDEFRESPKLPLTVVLDNVRSQNNIGSVFRTADAFRIEQIVLCGICSTPPHREIHKTALGAEDSVAWTYQEDTASCVRSLKERGYNVFAVEIAHSSLQLGADTLFDGQPLAIVFGNEVDGVQESVIQLCDGSLEIPQFGTKHSLNVSCAAAIVMWELTKTMRL